MAGWTTVAALIREMTQLLGAAAQYRSWTPEERAHQTRFEAEMLLLHATGWTKLELLQNLASDALPEICEKALSLSKVRMLGTPLAYILSHAYFYGRVFQTRPGCLIPRPDTEPLVEQACGWIEQVRPTSRVVDIGTGSGCIAITIALECSQATVEAVDVSSDAVAIARENAGALGASVRVWETDGIAWLRSRVTEEQVNVVVSNPPYIPTGDIQALDADVRLHEPLLALDGGVDGLNFYRSYADLGPHVFAPGPAALFLEVGMGQAEDVCKLFADNPLWADFTVSSVQDLRGVDRVISVTRPE